jgi:hypothetical protein
MTRGELQRKVADEAENYILTIITGIWFPFSNPAVGLLLSNGKMSSKQPPE